MTSPLGQREQIRHLPGQGNLPYHPQPPPQRKPQAARVSEGDAHEIGRPGLGDSYRLRDKDLGAPAASD